MWVNFVIQSKKIKHSLTLLFIALLLPTMPQCAFKQHSSVKLPNDILGIYIGMAKTDAEKRLEEIAKHERDERNRQEVWAMKNDSHFNYIAVGFDKNNQIRYVTAFVDAATAKERIRFSEVGDLTEAKAEILEPHRRYTWDVAAGNGKPAYQVSIYGDNPESLLFYTLSKKIVPGETQETEKDEDED